MSTNKTESYERSGGPGAIGMLSACLVVIAGCWMGLRPETILFRAVVSGISITILLRIIRAILTATVLEEDEQ